MQHRVGETEDSANGAGIARPRVAFLMEQALGHVTYARNLQTAYATSTRVNPCWLPIPFTPAGPLDRLPLLGRNWTLRGSRRAYSALRRAGTKRFDAVVYHTQTIALSAPITARQLPVILSLDATPKGFDTVGAYYQHHTRPHAPSERLKAALHRRIAQSAAALTTWSQWASDSLQSEYDVPSDRITVIPPGVNLELFPATRPPAAADAERRVRLLFVGGDFARKGGPLLLEAMRRGLAQHCDLDVVTAGPLPDTPATTVYTGLGPNDPRLLALYRDADIFVLPTYADCLAVVLAEAMAAALPIVTTSVAAQPEAVRDGESGIIIFPGDGDSLGAAVRRLAGDRALRSRFGRAGRAIAEQRFDARRNADRLLDVVESGIDRWRSQRSRRALPPRKGA